MSHSRDAQQQPSEPKPLKSRRFDIPVRNRLLAALPPDEMHHLMPHLELMDMPLKYSFYTPNEPITHVYFITAGVASLLMVGENGEAVEVGTVGHEGMVGLPAFLGADSTPGLAFMQVPGTALRLPVEVFRREATIGTRLHALLQRYTQAMIVQMAQGMACNRMHTIEQRAARWLLMTQDRVGDATFPLTQEFLAQMLGVRRAGVSEVASTLQEEGLIRYSRGVITVLERAKLEARACVCYRIIEDEYDRVFAGS